MGFVFNPVQCSELCKDFAEALQKLKDYHDYERTIRDQSKSVAYLEQQAKALENVSNSAAKAKLASIKNELASAKDTLRETKYSHEIELRSDGYERLAQDAQEATEKLIDSVRRSTELQDSIIEQMCAKAVANYTTAYNKINQIVDRYGLKNSNVTNQVITGIGDIGRKVDTLATNYHTSTESIVSDIRTHKTKLEELDSAYSDLATTIANLGTTYEKSAKNAQSFAEAHEVANNIDTTKITDQNDAGGQAAKNVEKVVTDVGNVDKDGNITGGDANAGQDKEQNDKKVETANKERNDDNKAIPETTQGNDSNAPKVSTPTTYSTTPTTPTPTTTTKKPQKTVTQSQIARALQIIDANLKWVKEQGKSWAQLNKDLWHKEDPARKIMIPEEAERAAYSALGSPEGSYSAVHLQTALKKTGLWDHLLKYRTKDGKIVPPKNISSFKSYSYYAKGSRNITKNQLGWTQDKGQELVYRRADGSILTPLGKGDKVFTAEMTDSLWQLAKGLTTDRLQQSTLDNAKIVNIKPVINMNDMDNSIIIQGNADETTVEQIRGIMDDRLNKFTKQLTEDFSMFGHKMKF